MRVSEYYGLMRNQGSLDFVDVDTHGDVPVFLDPRSIRLQDNQWARECQALLQSFFGEVLEAIAANNGPRLVDLLGRLGEPNETHLGYSRGRARGSGLGRGERSESLLDALSKSRAVETGLLHDLEDAALLIPGIGKDVISDVATHVLRGALIGYTHRMCDYYGIDVDSQHSGPVWNPDALEWQESFVDLPRADEQKLILVPKSIVRYELILDKDKYYNGYLAPYFEAREIDANSELVRVLRNNDRRVSVKDLRTKYPATKLAVLEYSLELPEALERYRSEAGKNRLIVIENDSLSEVVGSPRNDYRELLDGIVEIAPGPATAPMYHRATEKLLTAIFHPSLINFQLEAEIHEGRKRIDILYDNVAQVGFFKWVNDNYRCPVIPIECKNYSSDPDNPALDQLAGRLSNDRGWIGILVCRRITDKEKMTKRCRDAAKDGRGYLLVLDDADLEELVSEAVRERDESVGRRSRYPLLRRIFQRITG